LPESDASDLYGDEVKGGVFGVSCGDAAPSLKVQESIFDKMPQFIELFVVKSLRCAVFLCGNYGLHTLFTCLLKNCVAVITAIRQQIIRIKSFYQAASLRAIRYGTLCKKDSDRHTMRILG